MVERAQRDVHLHDAAQARRERRHAGREVRGVREHDHVGSRDASGARAGTRRGGSEPISSSPSTMNLTFTGRRPRASSQRAQRGEVHHDAGLVVDDAAPVQAAVAALRRLERRGAPVGLAARAAARRGARRGARSARRVRRAATRRPHKGGRRPRAASRRARARSAAAARPRPRRCARRSCGSKPAAETLGIRASASRSPTASCMPASSEAMTGSGAGTRRT